MPELSCEQVGAQVDELVTGCTSWTELGQQLSHQHQEHLSQCAACRNRAVELVEVERQLSSLCLEILPSLDLTAGVMARLSGLERPQSFPLLAWAPLALLLAFAIPDPDWLPSWLGLSFSWPGLAWSMLAWGPPLPEIPLGAEWLLASAALSFVISTLKWRQLARA